MIRLLLILFLTIQYSFATSYAKPERVKVFSQNKKFFIILDPDLKKHTVYSSAEPNKELWNFSLNLWHFTYVLSNDGTTVAIIFWEHVKEKDIDDFTALAFYKNGKLVKEIKLKKIYPDPPKTKEVGIGPVGDFWRTWYFKTAQNTDNVILELTNKKLISFSLKTCKQVNAPETFPNKDSNKIKTISLPPLDSDEDGLPDYLEIKYNLNPYKKDSADIDKDGFANMDESSHGSKMNDPNSHPDILYACKVISSKKDSAVIFNSLTGEKITIQAGEVFILKNRSGALKKFKATEIDANTVKIASYSMKEIIKLSTETKLNIIQTD